MCKKRVVGARERENEIYSRGARSIIEGPGKLIISELIISEKLINFQSQTQLTIKKVEHHWQSQV